MRTKTSITALMLTIVILFFSNSQCKSMKYPNCVKEVQKTVSVDSDFNRRFLQLTSFLFSINKQYGEQNAQQQIEEMYIANATYQISTKIKYMLIISMIGIICIVIIYIRIKGSHLLQMRRSIEKNLGGVVSPCVIISSIMAFAFFLFFAATLNRFPTFNDSSYCINRHLKNIVLYGDNQSNWAGLYGFSRAIKLYVQYLQTINGLNQSFYFQTSSIKSHRNERAAFAYLLTHQYETAYIQYNNQSIQYPILLPQLLDSKILLRNLNESIQKLIIISDLAITIENNLADFNLTNLDTRLSLQSKIPQFLMLAQYLQESSIFKQTQYNFMQNFDKFIITFSRVFIAIGLQSTFSYLCIVFIAIKIKYNLLLKFTNFLWVLFIFLLIMGIFELYLLSIQAGVYTRSCGLYEQILTNQSYFESLLALNSTADQNSFTLFTPCLFSNKIFKDFANYESDSTGLMFLIKNLTYYMTIMNPIQKSFIDPYLYAKIFSSTTKYILNHQYNVYQTWPYLNKLLEDLNKLTLENENGDNCYKHRWVFDQTECKDGESVLELTNNSLLINATDYANVSITCLSLNIKNLAGHMVRLANYSDILSNYLADKNVGRCNVTITQIQAISLHLTNAMQIKFNSLQSLIDTLQKEKIKLDWLLRILRSHYLLKKQQYSLMRTQGGTTNLTYDAIRNWNFAIRPLSNCSCIKEWSTMYFDNECLDKKTTIFELFLILIALEIILAVLILIGACYGLTEQIKQRDELLSDESSTDLDKYSEESKQRNTASEMSSTKRD